MHHRHNGGGEGKLVCICDLEFVTGVCTTLGAVMRKRWDGDRVHLETDRQLAWPSLEEGGGAEYGMTR